MRCEQLGLRWLLTDKYELTMLAARCATVPPSAAPPSSCSPPAPGRPSLRVVAGLPLPRSVAEFGFDDDALELLAEFLDPATVEYLRVTRFAAISTLRRGRAVLPGSRCFR
ncbi:nicotinate phosphoribosyltransferase domain protein [Mycobacterium xenopi 4042]|uniref:Nicotinate phosphoribosyltransferase domain protein n=1 Tax=Mycobacterium xenopi 4042 TaxID=1299334 RepID=X8CKJ4_MYCXE|nr:nicotinate phosphoribosyltransferase domain protein [Mycobacterium xenopi 4042]